MNRKKQIIVPIFVIVNFSFLIFQLIFNSSIFADDISPNNDSNENATESTTEQSSEVLNNPCISTNVDLYQSFYIDFYRPKIRDACKKGEIKYRLEFIGQRRTIENKEIPPDYSQFYRGEIKLENERHTWFIEPIREYDNQGKSHIVYYLIDTSMSCNLPIQPPDEDEYNYVYEFIDFCRLSDLTYTYRYTLTEAEQTSNQNLYAESLDQILSLPPPSENDRVIDIFATQKESTTRSTAEQVNPFAFDVVGFRRVQDHPYHKQRILDLYSQWAPREIILTDQVGESFWSLYLASNGSEILNKHYNDALHSNDNWIRTPGFSFEGAEGEQRWAVYRAKVLSNYVANTLRSSIKLETMGNTSIKKAIFPKQ